MILPSGSNNLVTPYSFSTTWKAVSRRSLVRRCLTSRQSIKSGLFLWIKAEKAKPSRHDPVKSFTRTPGYRAVDRRAHLISASRAVILSSCPTTMSEICTGKINKSLVQIFHFKSTINRIKDPSVHCAAPFGAHFWSWNWLDQRGCCELMETWICINFIDLQLTFTWRLIGQITKYQENNKISWAQH